MPTRECFIDLRQILKGLLSALQVHLNHPSSHQLKMVTQLYLFAFYLDNAIDRVTTGSYQRASLRTGSTTVVQQSSSRPIHHLKLWVSPLQLTSFNDSNSLYCLCVNASLPIRCQNSYLTSATTRHWTPCVLTCNYWTFPLL